MRLYDAGGEKSIMSIYVERMFVYVCQQQQQQQLKIIYCMYVYETSFFSAVLNIMYFYLCRNKKNFSYYDNIVFITFI